MPKSDSSSVKPYGKEGVGKKAEVAEMFDRIAPSYDLLNRMLSAGVDKGWRRKAVAKLEALQPGRVLDVATGTGDFALELRRLQPDEIVGVDIAEVMLEKGREKFARMNVTNIRMQYGDSENLPFEDGEFDAATVAFGVRNFEDLDRGLREIRRVLRSGGRLVVLEFSRPAGPIRPLFQLYFSKILPLIGRLISKDKRAYAYLFESVQAFPAGEDFLARLRAAGFKDTTCERLTFGICSIYTGDN